MPKEKQDRTRLTLDLSKSDLARAKKLEEIYDVSSQAEAVRTAIRHDLYLAQIIKDGGTIQHTKKDGTVETVVFTEWMSFM
jgi:hypothetical protein